MKQIIKLRWNLHPCFLSDFLVFQFLIFFEFRIQKKHSKYKRNKNGVLEHLTLQGLKNKKFLFLVLNEIKLKNPLSKTIKWLFITNRDTNVFNKKYVLTLWFNNIHFSLVKYLNSICKINLLTHYRFRNANTFAITYNRYD